MSDEIINSLWIGSELSNLEVLTAKSFIANGHRFRLWTYDLNVRKYLPDEVMVADANEIIPLNQVFSYSKANQYGHGKGSYAGFSDIFRYKLLFIHGGWWTDMDITCLKHFDFSGDYFFRAHHDLPLVGNVMKCPSGSELMRTCFEEAEKNVNAINTDWHKPIEILCTNVKKLGLEKFITNNVSNQDRWEETLRLIKKDTSLPANYYFIHWQNEEWRHRLMDKNIVKINSTLGALMQRYGLLKTNFTKKELLINRLQLLPLYSNLKLLGIIKD